MQRLTGNHWVTHAVIVLALYVGGGWLFAQSNGGQGVRLTANNLIAVLMSGVMAGALIIAGFYLLRN